MSPLPEWHALVVAAVDGEISLSDRRKLREILKTNRDARRLLRDYREQANLLSQAQSPPLPCDFASVFRNESAFRNGEKQLQPTPAILSSGKPTFSNSLALASWVALALSLLLVLGVGFAFLPQPRDESALKQSDPAPNQSPSEIHHQDGSKNLLVKSKNGVFTQEKGPKYNSDDSSGPTNPTAPTQTSMATVAGKSSKTTSNSNEVASTGKEPPAKQPQNVSKPAENLAGGASGQPTLLTAPYSDPGTLVESSISVPNWISWENPRLELTTKSVSKTLLLEIPCNDSIVVSNQLIQILKNQKKGVLVDRLAQDRLIQKNIRSHFGVCLEDATITDLEKLLAALKSDVENLKNKTALPPLGKGIALLPAEAELPPVFQFSNHPETLEKAVSQLSDLAPNPNLAKSPGKTNEGSRKLLQPTLNSKGKVDALVLAQSPYYPEVRSSSSSQEISLYRKLKPKLDSQGYRIIIFLRQLHI